MLLILHGSNDYKRLGEKALLHKLYALDRPGYDFPRVLKGTFEKDQLLVKSVPI